jgi:hypothetical protein
MMYTILSSTGLQKKLDMNSFIYFSFPAVTLKLQFSNLQFSNFKRLVIPKSTTLSKLSDVLSANFQIKLSQNGE